MKKFIDEEKKFYEKKLIMKKKFIFLKILHD